MFHMLQTKDNITWKEPRVNSLTSFSSSSMARTSAILH